MVRKTHLQAHLSAMREKRLSNVETDEDEEASEAEEAMETEAAATTDKPDPINFKDPVILNHIADIFQLCQAKSGLKNLSCLLYITLRHFGKSWDDSNDFLTAVGAYTSMWLLLFNYFLQVYKFYCR
jgi:hypothetical protein